MTAGPTLTQALRASGWTTTRLDLRGVADKAAFMERCARALDLPDWFGRNWDALADCLTDLSWAPPAQGRVLLVTGWQTYAGTRPDEWGTAQEVFADAVTYWRGRDTGMEILLTIGDGGSDDAGAGTPG
ncbi:barstar family protein [Streptomyces sp. NPDC058001]|uniref:barstar family protein n=1 Tax=Streptomyces sp. NPDC058001 TaxID=3346300 RepID=UPI0036EB6F48